MDRDATRKALMDSVKIGKVSGIRSGAEVLRVLAGMGSALRAKDALDAAKKLDAMADKIDAEIPRHPIR